jgi:putative membrane protein
MYPDTVTLLDARATLYFVLRRFLLWVFLALWLATMFGGLLVPHAAAGEHPWLPALACLAALLMIDAALCYVRANSYAIELRAEGVALRYGVLRQVHETLIYGKIQEILVSSNVLERLLGLATLSIQSAAGSPEVIPAMDAQSARALRDAILERTQR